MSRRQSRLIRSKGSRGPSATADPEELGRYGLGPDQTAAMLRRWVGEGKIDKRAEDAALRFQELFRLAQLDPLRAQSFERTSRGDSDFDLHPEAERARKTIRRILDRLGGQGAPASSALWHCIGNSETLREWANHAGHHGTEMNRKVATGVLIGTLSALHVIMNT